MCDAALPARSNRAESWQRASWRRPRGPDIRRLCRQQRRDWPPDDLMAAMRAAADRDLVAWQYAENFRLVLDETLPALIAGRQSGWTLTDAIIHTHLSLIAHHGDTLISRKCGSD